MPNIVTGKYVHVVATVDLQRATGRILYVNPSEVHPDQDVPALAAGLPEPKGYQLSVEDGSGNEIARLTPSVNLPSDTDAPPTEGLIDETILRLPGMQRLVLLHDGKPVSTYSAGKPGGELPANEAVLEMGASPPGHSEKRTMTLPGSAGPVPGVSYTVQVRPSNGTEWRTISVGRDTPDFVIDRNQFAGAESARVRVLRTDGFSDEVAVEQTVDLRFNG